MRPHPAPRPRLQAALAVTLAASGVLAIQVAGGQTQKPPASADPEINKPFADPDVRAFVARFETESREVYVRRAAIVAAIDLKPGMSVADLGAGTGLFTRLMAEKVGPRGRVYAVDISPSFLAHVAAESKRLGQTQVRTVRGTQDGTNLSENSVDLVFLCDVYHHLEKPGRVLASVRRALRPGGQLVVVEFDRVEGRSSDFVLKHVRAGKAVFASEIREAGFTPVPVPNAPPLKENFLLRFRKSDAPPAGDGPVGVQGL